MQRDLLGQIADARARMMMRGAGALRLDMGPDTARAFAAESAIADIEDYSRAVMNMPIRIRADMEGWAVRAAGELELEEAVPLIAPFLTEGDRQMMETAVWALGEIGGAEARRLLSSMLRYAEDTDDAELLELVEDAIASASLIGGGMVFDA